MRSDMSKVLIERPRHNHKDLSKKTGQRLHRYDPGDEYEDFPQREPASKGRGTKQFTDLLGPLIKFLRSNVGRPWDKVYSELCAHLDRRKTTGQHVFQHLEDYVEVNCFVGDEGEIYARQRNGGVRRIGEHTQQVAFVDVSGVQRFGVRLIDNYRYGHDFYVDPRTGLLRLEKKRISQATRAAQRRQVRNTIERKPISFDQSYLRLNGIWYIADYLPTEGKAPTTLEMELKLSCEQRLALKEFGVRYWNGKHWMMMISKRKCSQQELQAAGLQNVPLKK